MQKVQPKKSSERSASTAAEDRIKSTDYKSWDQYNVDKECSKLEKKADSPAKKPGGNADIAKLSERGETLNNFQTCSSLPH